VSKATLAVVLVVALAVPASSLAKDKASIGPEAAHVALTVRW
jgi:hypothetical protein